ncbi:MAG: MOSC domain-containing protein [Burkholderiales bacterium]|nr:MOSC domain-containing protein [Burkholderiales bacterium]
MARVVALYRYPVKGFTPERVARITVLPGGRVAGDRVLNFRFADAPVADTAWCRKYHGVVLANTPGLARLEVRFDEPRQRLTIGLGGRTLADHGLDPAGRRELVQAITDYVLHLEDNPLQGAPQRLPLKLVGDGTTPRYQDNEAGQVTLHARESLAAAAMAFGDAALSELRFRHNIVIDGVSAWEEQGWVGSKLRVGDVVFERVVAKVRCLATHANPLTGERDLPVMQLLVKAFAQRNPTFGVGMLSDSGGEIRVGDCIALA